MMGFIRIEPMLLALIVGLAVVIWAAGSLWRSAGVSDIPGPRLVDVLAGVKEEIRLARNHSDLAALPNLSKVEVELEVMISESTEGAVSASIVPLKASAKSARTRSQSTTQKVKIVLQPPSRSMTQEGDTGLEDHSLAKAIVEVAQDLAESAETPPRLDVASVEFNVKFAVESSLTTEGGFELKVLGVSETKSDSEQSSHNVKLVFAPPKVEVAPSWDEG